jgi:hypothetical protein
MRVLSDHQVGGVLMHEALSVLQLAKSLIPSLAKDADLDPVLEEFLLWPPDLFALTSSILSVSGAYYLVVSPPGHSEVEDVCWPPDGWTEHVRRIGLAWRVKLNRGFDQKEFLACKSGADKVRIKKIRKRTGNSARAGAWVPKEIWGAWASFKKGISPEWEGDIEEALCEGAKNPEDLRKLWKPLEGLLTLHAIADEACVGWGIRKVEFDKLGHEERSDEAASEERYPARRYAEDLLRDHATLATINALRGRVLPKRHTPDVGITLRSLSSNLSYHRSSVKVSWKDYPPNNPLGRNLLGKSKTFSILLLPWPLEIQSTWFRAEEASGIAMNDSYGFFSYSPPGDDLESFRRLLEKALTDAKREVKTVDIVVLPECALSENELEVLEEVLGRESVSAYVAGVRSVKDERTFSQNKVYFKVGRLDEAGECVRFDDCDNNVQHKHHRWKLDRSQITKYSLGHILSPSRHWWEAIKIPQRKVTFVNVGEEVTICPLICEDLARQDPIAELIRTVGPSLVITVLMDGPQKMDRWSARYASVLAEDPGSAVIALTSAGMVRRWRPPHRETSNVVALWNDGRGSAREIELETNSIGVLLGLCTESHREPTADGRVELFGTNTITLGSIHQVGGR